MHLMGWSARKKAGKLAFFYYWCTLLQIVFFVKFPVHILTRVVLPRLSVLSIKVSMHVCAFFAGLAIAVVASHFVWNFF